MIKKLLVANRGEIAVRIMRSCREMDIDSVAVFSDADRASMHVRYATEAYHIGPSPLSESYLNIEKIIKTALACNADAIHPGYGFLSENAEFARQVEAAGIKFIGPSPDSIEKMGDKITARKIMIDAGIPVVPGIQSILETDQELLDAAGKIGYPLMVKASAGGGGKGMRLVNDPGELILSYQMARSEAKSAFGSDEVYIEKYIESPHHIEFQILADTFGNTIHLFERECSVQRRHQKVVEETPSPLIPPQLREEMGQKAIAAAQTVGYIGAGTIEFLVDSQLNYYFLEMNTRLQVEHPITERVTGIDLVKQQILIAEGKQLAFKQTDLMQFGHAIECRIYAEDPENNFMPSPGIIKHITEPMGLGIRTDGYVYEGFSIPVFYDPLISKLIVWARTRTEAISRMKRALYEYKITGIKTSIPFLRKIMETPAFVEGKYDTHFIKKHEPLLLGTEVKSIESEDFAIFIAYLDYNEKMKKNTIHANSGLTDRSVWKNYTRIKNINRF